MAYKKKDIVQYIQICEKDYLDLLEHSMILRALKIAGIEEMPIYESVHSIISDGRVEIHIKPIKGKYK